MYVELSPHLHERSCNQFLLSLQQRGPHLGGGNSASSRYHLLKFAGIDHSAFQYRIFLRILRTLNTSLSHSYIGFSQGTARALPNSLHIRTIANKYRITLEPINHSLMCWFTVVRAYLYIREVITMLKGERKELTA